MCMGYTDTPGHIRTMETGNFRKLKPEIREKLIRVNLTKARKILTLRADELQKIGNFTSEDAEQIFLAAAETLVGPSSFKEIKFITTGCRIIDQVLGGGLNVGAGITELSGESGCGKTQLCLQLALTTQNPVHVGGMNKFVVYICTEDSFPSKRLQQMINNIRLPFINSKKLPYGDRIYIEHLIDVKGLKSCLSEKLPKLLATNSVGLLVIDSVAAVFRSDYSLQQGNARTKDLRTIGLQLHALSKKYEFGILCVNQVSSSPSNNANVPALGLAWANLVTTRVLMSKESSTENVRKMELLFSPYTGPNHCHYRITEFGVEGYPS